MVRRELHGRHSCAVQFNQIACKFVRLNLLHGLKIASVG
jgi:hypothetical protein